MINPQLVKTVWGQVQKGVYIYWVWKSNPHYFIRISSACAKRWLLSRIIWSCTDFDQYKSGYLCCFGFVSFESPTLIEVNYYAFPVRVWRATTLDADTAVLPITPLLIVERRVKSDSGAAFWHRCFVQCKKNQGGVWKSLCCSDIAHSLSKNGLFSPFLACWAGEEEPSLNVVFTNCNRQILHSMQPKLEPPGKQCIFYGDLCCNTGPNCISLHNTQDWSLTV